MAQTTNLECVKGGLADGVKEADIFIGCSAPNSLTPEMVKSMAPDPIIFAMANPTPEIFPDDAFAAGAKIVATGRSDYPNQVNNVLAFPGIFKGTFAVRATDINEDMKMAAANAIADLVTDEDRASNVIIPSPFLPGVADKVASAVADAARKSGVARK